MQSILKATSITKKIENVTTLDCSLEVFEGDIFGIVGKSGAGKTTLLRCLSGLTPISSGTLVNHAKSWAMIFQQLFLLESKTIYKNISLPLEIDKWPEDQIRSRVESLLQTVGLSHKIAAYPASLSGGEKQRVAIARALVKSPSLLFCDEATSALDPKTAHEILELLKTLNKQHDVTIVLITHDMNVIKKICTKVAILEKGNIIEQGSTLDLFYHPRNPSTQELVQNISHDLNLKSLKESYPNSFPLRLHFKGDSAKRPLLSQLISSYGLEVNILSGWIDTINQIPVGSLTITLSGTITQYEQAIFFFKQHQIAYEELL